MTPNDIQDPQAYVDAIRKRGLTIYDEIAVGDPELWIPTTELEQLLDTGLRGMSLEGLALRTRSKVVKARVCTVLGYAVPTAFKKTQPRFPGQSFDTYVQKSNNLQIWNEELSATRRYVLVRTGRDDVICRVKVVMGDALAELDTTGTLTQKYQARCNPGEDPTELISGKDTAALSSLLYPGSDLVPIGSPAADPDVHRILPIQEVFDRLSPLVGRTFVDVGIDQERNRGAGLHRLVCEALGFKSYQDNGQFPDVRNQLIEVKLQSSPTIDLGLVCPNSTEPLDVTMLDGQQIRHCDVRYAVFYGRTYNSTVEITHFFLTTGEDFFGRFPQFGGRILNGKLQIPLPAGFFDA